MKGACGKYSYNVSFSFNSWIILCEVEQWEALPSMLLRLVWEFGVTISLEGTQQGNVAEICRNYPDISKIWMRCRDGGDLLRSHI